MIRRLALLLVLTASLNSNAQRGGLSSTEQTATRQMKSETVREVTTTLSSKEMEGRGMAQPGGDRAAKYLADQFARAGLKPGGNASTCFQQIKVNVQTLMPDTQFKVG